MKFALVGCGRISKNHISAAIENKLEIDALCDIEPSKMKALDEKFGLSETGKCAYYTDYIEMLETEKPDLVAICTESGSHAAIAVECLMRDVSVIIEKPLALSLKDADAVLEAEKKSNAKVCTCHQNRFNKSIQRIRAAYESQRFGVMMHGAAHIRWNRGKDYYDQAPWRGTWMHDGGALMNQCIHNIDILRWMMGDEIEEVFAYTAQKAHHYLEAEDLGLAVVKFSNGSYGLIEGTTNVFPENLEETLYLFGTEGTVKAGGKSVNILEEWNFADDKDDPIQVINETREMPTDIYGFGHTPLYADMIDAIINDRAPYVDGEAGRRALELVLAIYKSSKEGTPVKFPLDDFSTIDMEGFFD